MIILPNELTDEIIDKLNYKPILLQSFENIEELKEKITSFVLVKKLPKESIRLFKSNYNLEKLMLFLKENINYYQNNKKLSVKSEHLYSLESK